MARRNQNDSQVQFAAEAKRQKIIKARFAGDKKKEKPKAKVEAKPKPEVKGGVTNE